MDVRVVGVGLVVYVDVVECLDVVVDDVVDFLVGHFRGDDDVSLIVADEVPEAFIG